MPVCGSVCCGLIKPKLKNNLNPTAVSEVRQEVRSPLPGAGAESPAEVRGGRAEVSRCAGGSPRRSGAEAGGSRPRTPGSRLGSLSEVTSLFQWVLRVWRAQAIGSGRATWRHVTSVQVALERAAVHGPVRTRCVLRELCRPAGSQPRIVLLLLTTISKPLAY